MRNSTHCVLKINLIKLITSFKKNKKKIVSNQKIRNDLKYLKIIMRFFLK